MGRMYVELNDVKGAFLNGEFSKGEDLYMEVPQGFEKYHDPAEYVLYLLRTIYGLKQAAYEYWKMLLTVLKALSMLRNKADPCVYFKWKDGKLSIWSSWIDDILSAGPKRDVVEGRETLKQYFDLDEVGEMEEYVGCKVEYNHKEGWIKLTQPVLLQSYVDEFDASKLTKPVTPGIPKSVLLPNQTEKLDKTKHRLDRKGVGKLLHLAPIHKTRYLKCSARVDPVLQCSGRASFKGHVQGHELLRRNS